MLIRSWACCGVASLLATPSMAGVAAYTNLADWQLAVDALTDDTRLVDFNGLPNGTPIGSGEFGPGVTFRNYQGLSTFPRVDNDSPYGGGWLTNRNNGGFDEFVDGFVFDFLEPIFAVSLNDNPAELVRLRLYDSDDNIIGEQSNSRSSTFLGLISTQPIAYATVINLPPEDGVFAIDNLRFAIPEPSSLALLGITALGLSSRRGRGRSSRR